MKTGHIKCTDKGADKVKKVLLDGIEIEDVTEVHTEEGWLVKYARPHVIDRETDELITERLEGRVELVWDE